MKSSTPVLVLTSSVVASVLSAMLCVFALREVWAGEGPEPELRVELARLGDRVESLAERLDEDADSPAHGTASESVELQGALGALRQRVERIEEAARRKPAAGNVAQNVDGSGASPESDAEQVVEELAGSGRTLEQAEFTDLLGRVLSGAGDVSQEDQARFWEAARSTGYVDALLGELTASVEENPEDVTARLGLADAYVAKLLTVPAGPERGVWGGKAEEQWRTALELDPRSWDAQFRLAENFSYYPEFLNKTGEAITGLERARGLQEEIVVEPRHAKTYLLLFRLYARDGRQDEALAALRDGLARHPDNKELVAALAAAGEGR
jgi:tetratricopeptide (TPR) repeat protein